MSIIDTHLHLQDFKDENKLAVLNNSFLEKAILISATIDDFAKIDDLLSLYNHKFASAFGLHPWQAKTEYDLEMLCKYLEKHPKALIGEIGVDNLREPCDEQQHILFNKQLDIAKKYNRPVVIHAAKAFNELTLHKNQLEQIKFVHHGFVTNFELLKFINKCDGYFGLGSLFLKQEKAKEMFAMMNINRILFETDAPFRVNEDNYNNALKENLNKLAEIASLSFEQLTNILTTNAKEFMKC